MPYVEVTNVSKTLGTNCVLSQVSMQADTYQIVGLMGENGSGKTMLLRAIAGLLIPNEGTIRVSDELIGKDREFPQNMGILIEEPALLKDYSAAENLKMLQSITHAPDSLEIERQLARVGLSDAAHQKVKTFSLGMKIRLGIAQALIDSPALILLDEPTNALDEDALTTLVSILQEERKRGASVIVASHDRDFMQAICNSCYTMRSGKITKSE